ncbi:MAG: hypothetical protein K9G30_01990 [Parvibaculum sp.]|nr:hypothetical protein [Parvibaculum sp.]
MVRRMPVWGFALLLSLPAPALAQAGDIGAIARDAAAAADMDRGKVTGDETFQGGFTCLAPANAGDTGPILCESGINPVLPIFYFTLAWHLDGANGERVIDAIAVRRKGETQPFQTIEAVGSRTVPDIENNGFELIDMNFDGYLDLRLIGETSAGPNVAYANWLWSDGDRRFVRAPALDGIVSPEFDPETQEILSRWRSSAAEGGVDIYTWEEGGPVLIHREVDRYDGASRCSRSFFDRIGGALQKTGEGACS